MVSCSGFVEPLNLQCWLLNIFSGNTIIFLSVAILFISVLASRFRMTGMILMLILAIFTIMFAEFERGLYILLLLIVGFVVYPLIKRAVSRQ